MRGEYEVKLFSLLPKEAYTQAHIAYNLPMIDDVTISRICEFIQKPPKKQWKQMSSNDKHVFKKRRKEREKECKYWSEMCNLMYDSRYAIQNNRMPKYSDYEYEKLPFYVVACCFQTGAAQPCGACVFHASGRKYHDFMIEREFFGSSHTGQQPIKSVSRLANIDHICGRGSGSGTAIIKTIERFLRNQKRQRKIHSYVIELTSDPEAVGFYQKLKYKQFGLFFTKVV